MRRLCPLLAVALLAAVGGATHSQAAAPATPVAHSSPLAPQLGISYRTAGGTLAWFDPLTLTTLPGRKAPLARHVGSWAFSADRSRVAIASCDSPSLRFVNPRSMRVLGDLRLAFGGSCAAWLTWLRPDRLLAVQTLEDEAVLYVVDPLARRIVRREPLGGRVLDGARTEQGLVLLLSGAGGFRPAVAAFVDADGTVRSATISRVLAGSVQDGESGSGDLARIMQPGLAADPATGRAFVVGTDSLVADVDPATLEVRYHDLSGSRSVLRRLADWLVPAAQAKGADGPVRSARWVGDGLIAVSGTNSHFSRDADGNLHGATQAIGLTLVDTRSWSSRLLNPDASGFELAGGLVVAEGGSFGDGPPAESRPVGLVAYDLSGAERWRLYAGTSAWLGVAGPLGYAYPSESRCEVVDLASGTVLQALTAGPARAWPQLLAGRNAAW